MNFSLDTLKGTYLLSILAFIVSFVYANYSIWKSGNRNYDYITPSITAVFTLLAIYLNIIPRVTDEILVGGYPMSE